jgi:hypothetical protein
MSLLVGAVIFVAWAYWLYTARPLTTRGAIALIISVAAALAAYDGTVLAMREYARAHEGVVTSGLVVGKFNSTGTDGTPGLRSSRSRSYRRSFATTEGFAIHDELARLILTGSTNAWVIDYRYGCARAQGCRGRDFVTEDLWRTLSIGQAVNVRRSRDETNSSRLDANVRWHVAAVDLAFATALFVVAAGLSGRLTPRRARYLTAPAVVTAVEPVKYRDVTRWRVRFAYFDPKGDPQESTDEVVKNVWKPGDDCVAVFPPDQPALASFRPSAPYKPV